MGNESNIMRRSSAPSCQSSQTAKRGKFVAPFKANAAQSNNAISTPLSVSAFSERTTKGLQTEKFIEKKDITNSENGSYIYRFHFLCYIS